MRNYKTAAESDLGLPANSYVYNITTTSSQHDVRSQSYPAMTFSDNIIAISSDDSIRSLDPATLKVRSTVTKAHDSITSIKRYANSGAQCTTFLTSGRDGRVRGWDLRSGSKALEFSAPKNEPLSALECSAELQAVVAGTELEGNAPGDVSIFGWDMRMPSELKMKYEESHNDTVTELRFLPAVGSTNTLLLSAGTDGLVNIFNTATAEEEDALFQVIKSSSALQHAGIIGGDIYTLGTDETLSFHAFQNPDLDTQDPAPCELGDVREQFGCEYVVGMYENHSNKPYLAVGNHSEGWLDLMRFKNKATSPSEARNWRPKSTEDNRIRLVGGHGEELVRDVLFAGNDVVYTCGEDGIVRAWKNESDGDMEMSGTKKRKADRSERKDKRSKGIFAK
jgi:WD40 repeat protein